MVDAGWIDAAVAQQKKCKRLEAELARLRAARDEALEVVKPLVDAADANDEAGHDDPDEDRIWIVQAYGCQIADLTIADLRAARRFYEKHRGGENG